MVFEVAILQVIPARADSFEKDFKTASQWISSIDGYLRHSLRKCVEDNYKYLLLVEWENLEDHTIGFRESSQYQQWKALLHPYYDPFPIVEHYEVVFEKDRKD